MSPIIVDTREQLPLFKKHEAIYFKLFVGDYSTMKLRDTFCIERKSLQDLYGTLTSGHVRFRKEIIRAEVNGCKLILIVEGTKEQFINKLWPGGYKRQMSGATLAKIIHTVELRYNLEVTWCRSRSAVKKLIVERLKKEELKHGKATRGKRIAEEAPKSRGVFKQQTVR